MNRTIIAKGTPFDASLGGKAHLKYSVDLNIVIFGNFKLTKNAFKIEISA